MEIKIFYRIEHPENFGGAWYNEDGTDNRIVDTLTNPTLAGLPMERDDERYRADGKKWQCAAWSIEHLIFWFSPEDAEELVARGFKLCKFKSTEHFIDENQVMFTKEGVVGLEYFDSYKELFQSEVRDIIDGEILTALNAEKMKL